jgi:hypothetical protein
MGALFMASPSQLAYNSYMKSLFLRLSTFLLPSTLFIFGLGLSLLMVFGQPQPIKSAVTDSGLYSVLVDDVLAEQGQTTIGTLSIPLTDPHIKQAIAQAFTPAVLQNAGDQILDGFYAWIQGKTEQPVISVNLNGAKEQAAENIATYVAARVASLPTCSTSELYQIYNSGALASGNYYSFTCRPASLSTQTVHDTVNQSILGSSDFANKITLDASTITDENGQPLYKKLSFIPKGYKITVWSTYATGVIALLAIAGIIFLRSNKRLGLKRAAIVLLAVGIPSMLLAIATAWGSTYLERLITSASGNTAALQVKFAAIARELVTDVRTWWLWISGIEIALGIGLLVGLRFSRKLVVVPPVPRIDDVTPIKEVERHPAPQNKIEL